MPFSSPSAAAFSAALTSSAVVGLVEHRDQVHHRNVRRGNAHGVAVQLALQLRHHQADGLGGAGGGGDHVERGGAGAAQVLVREVEHVLVVGVAVDRGHRSLLDAELVVQHLHHRRQAVGGAGGVGNDVVLGRIVHVVVHAQHDGDVFVLRRRGDDDLFHRAAQVLAGVLGVGEPAGGFDHDLRAHRIPVELAPDPCSANTLIFLPPIVMESASEVISSCNVPSTESYFSRCASVFVSVRSLTATNSISLRCEARADDIPADAAEAIDTNFYCHFFSCIR